MNVESSIQLDSLDYLAHPEEQAPYRDNAAVARENGDEASVSLLKLVSLLQSFKIHPINVCLIDSLGVGAMPATGSLGKGGQYMVDRVFDNQRYPTVVAFKSESNTVYKRMFRSQDDPRTLTMIQENHKLQSFIRELRVLGHFRKHANIVDILGVAWEDVEGHIYPILALEFAQLNALPRFIDSVRNTPLVAAEKRKLTKDIVSGLSAIHDAGFIWGDCKPDNVLVFRNEAEPTGLNAKLNDFGCSISHPSAESRFVGFSEPWLAPEAYSAQGAEALQRAETYSLGMLIWFLQMDGMQFHPHYWEMEGEESAAVDHDDVSSSHPQISKARIDAAKSNGQLVDVAVKSVNIHLGTGHQGKQGSRLSKVDLEAIRQVLEATMAQKPEDRSLPVATILSHSTTTTQSYLAESESIQSIDVDELVGLYGPQTCLDRVAGTVLQRLQEYSHTSNRGSAFYKASICYLIGLGTVVNLNKALAFMKRSAVNGYLPAKALYATLLTLTVASGVATAAATDAAASENIHANGDDDLIYFDDFSQIEGHDTDHMNDSINPTDADWSTQGMLTGSVWAAINLKQKDPGYYKAVLADLRNLYQGVGVKAEWRPIEMNKRGELYQDKDNLETAPELLIHRAAQSGDSKAVDALLDRFKVSTEARNGDGETPLVCAIRAGHMHIAATLIRHGADVETIDDRGATILHWLISLTNGEITQIRPYLPNSIIHHTTQIPISYSQHLGSTMQPGTPLDWAVDARNKAAITVLLESGADPLNETANRTSAFHRSVSKYDCEILSILIESKYFPRKGFQHFDRLGQSPLSYALQPVSLIERALLGNPDPIQSNMAWTISMLLHHGADPWIVNEVGESALYCGTKCNSVHTAHRILQESDASRSATARSGPNRWSPLRRALYSQDTRIFHQTCFCLQSSDDVSSLVDEVSPDGLTLLHECAFLPGTSGALHAKKLRSALQTSENRWENLEKRLSARGQRPALTPFQLAVLCHNFELADLLVKWGCSPLRGVDRSRFLGFLISYQMQNAYEPSTFLNAIIEDPVVNQIRRFPHPATMHSSIAYLLMNESAWWKSNVSLGRDKWKAFGPDADIDNDPGLSWQPGIDELMTTFKRIIKEPRETIASYGYGGLFDSNDLGFGVRARHIKDYRSFILAFRNDNVTEQQYAHKYVTALDSAFDSALKSPYPHQAEQVFHLVLDHFSSRQYCNFPRFHYLPTLFFQRTSQRYLRRRETVLHRAIRGHKITIVKHLLEAGADWNMANINWQTPLHLARLLDFGKDPNTFHNHGSFLLRLGLAKPVEKTPVYADSSDTTHILALLEDAALTTSAGPWPFVRALKEVRWPWDDYETDDMGIRFLLFDAILASIIILPILFIAGIVTLYRPTLSDQGVQSVGQSLGFFHNLGEQLENCKRNSSAHCATANADTTRNVASTYVTRSDDLLSAIEDDFEDCMKLEQLQHLDHKARVLACGFRISTNKNTPRTDGNLTTVHDAEIVLARKICGCKCTMFGSPYVEKK